MVYNIYYGYHSPVILNLLIRMLEIYTINNLCHIFVSTSNFLKASHLTNNIKVVFCFLLSSSKCNDYTQKWSSSYYIYTQSSKQHGQGVRPHFQAQKMSFLFREVKYLFRFSHLVGSTAESHTSINL